MQDSDKDKNTSDDSLDDLDSEDLDFEDDFDFEDDWEDDADLDEILAEEDGSSAEPNIDSSPEESIDPPENNPEHKFGSKQKSEPDNFPKTKKKRSLTLLITILVIFLAVGLTAYNTLRPSLSPTLLPVIKLPGSSVGKNDDNFMNDAQKRIDEIIEKKNTDRSAKNDLTEPFETKNSVQDASQGDDVSVLTPLPTNFDNSADDLPSLEEALEQVPLGTEEIADIELSDGSEFIDDGSAIDPFSEDALLDTINEDPPTLDDIETIGFPETLDLQNIDSPPFPTDDQNNAEALAFEQEEVAKEALALKNEAAAATKAKLEAEEKVKEEARKAALEAQERKKAEEAAASAKEKANSAKTKKVVKTSPAPIWEIRGIRPGRAVLYDKVSGDIEAVEPGSKIRGLGRIKEISKKHGRWVVLGDKGNVTQ